MKKLLPFLSLALFTAAACNTAPEKKSSVSPVEHSAITAPVEDTTGMAAFKAWKAQNELSAIQQFQQVQPQAVAQKPAVKRTSSSAPVKKATAPVKRSSTPASSSGSSDNSSANGNTGTDTQGTGDIAKATKKEGWSKAAKGAVIGGVAGAAGGAVINKKNRVLGAVIGGVIGAAGGYGIGRTMDKKDGRIEMNP